MVAFDKDSGPAILTGTIFLGASWDGAGKDTSLKGRYEAAKRKAQGTAHPSDLDAFAFFMVKGEPKRYLGLNETDCFQDEDEPGGDSCALHSGDNPDGTGSGIDEGITLYLDRIPMRIDKIALTVGAFKVGTAMASATNVRVRLYDGLPGGGKPPELTMEPSLRRARNMLSVAVMERQPGTRTWEMNMVDSSFDVRQGDMDDLLTKVMAMR